MREEVPTRGRFDFFWSLINCKDNRFLLNYSKMVYTIDFEKNQLTFHISHYSSERISVCKRVSGVEDQFHTFYSFSFA